MTTTATSPVFVFQTSNRGQHPPSAAVLAEIKKLEGFQRAYFGVKMEDPETAVLCTEWSSLPKGWPSRDSEASRSSAPGGAEPTEERFLAFATTATSEWRAALEAPCTEVFTAFGVEEGFAGNVERFVKAVEGSPPVGYRGAAFGEGTEPLGDGGQAVRMVIGWTSREAHIEAKGKPGAIQENLHELRTLRRTVDLFHVEFKEV